MLKKESKEEELSNAPPVQDEVNPPEPVDLSITIMEAEKVDDNENDDNPDYDVRIDRNRKNVLTYLGGEPTAKGKRDIARREFHERRFSEQDIQGIPQGRTVWQHVIDVFHYIYHDGLVCGDTLRNRLKICAVFLGLWSGFALLFAALFVLYMKYEMVYLYVTMGVFFCCVGTCVTILVINRKETEEVSFCIEEDDLCDGL